MRVEIGKLLLALRAVKRHKDEKPQKVARSSTTGEIYGVPR